MRQEYKKTFDQIHVSDELEDKLLNIPQDISLENSQKRYISRRFAYVVLVAILICIPTISVLAANGFDVAAVFGRFFGNKVALVEDNAALPEVNVLSNTFENIDIVPTGIVGDKNLVFITMDVIKKDGSNFNEEELVKREGIFNSDITLKKASDILSQDDNTNNQDTSASDVEKTDLDNIEYNEAASMYFFPISSDDVDGNKLSLVYVVGVKTELNGNVYDMLDETYYLRFSNYNTEGDFGYGVWEGEVTANYKEPDSIKFDVNKVAQMPKWGTDDKYLKEAEMKVNSMELSPLRLKYVCEYDNTVDLYKDDISYWDKIYIVMDDGSIVGGRNTFDNYINGIKEGTSGISITSFPTDLSTYTDDGPWEYYITFNQIIDTAKVKEVHIGSLTIDVK